MNSRNEKSKTQGELSARPVRQRPALMLTFLTLLGLILEACGSTATKITPAMETPCPRRRAAAGGSAGDTGSGDQRGC